MQVSGDRESRENSGKHRPKEGTRSARSRNCTEVCKPGWGQRRGDGGDDTAGGGLEGREVLLRVTGAAGVWRHLCFKRVTVSQ